MVAGEDPGAVRPFLVFGAVVRCFGWRTELFGWCAECFARVTGLLLGGPSLEPGACTSVGREWVLELGCCLKLLGLCPKMSCARVVELGVCREIARWRVVGGEWVSGGW